MNGPAAIQTALAGTQFVFNAFLQDLSDADLFVRPVPGANHIAWQLGHLIHSEVFLLKDSLPAETYPALPAGVAETYSREGSTKDGPSGFLTKAQYLDLFAKVRNATMAAVGRLTDADLDKPNTGPLGPYAPTLGALLMLVSNHTLMHGGQFTVVRRKLGKPVVF